MHRKIIILGLLVLVALADTELTMDCYECNGILCIVLNGGPFVNASFPSNTGTSCLLAGDFPYTYNFTCKSKCQDCSIVISTFNQFPTGYCSESQVGDQFFTYLNLCYSEQTGDPNASYDWCNCGRSSGLSGGQIAGIVVGVVCSVTVIGLVYWYCFKKKTFSVVTSKKSPTNS
jgi:hypothetical protein